MNREIWLDERAKLQSILDDIEAGKIVLRTGEREYLDALKVRLANLDEKIAQVGKRERPMLTTKPPVGDVIFSFLDGHVWTSWPGVDASVNLGPYDGVTEMMRDFLAQCELGERLANRGAAND